MGKKSRASGGGWRIGAMALPVGLILTMIAAPAFAQPYSETGLPLPRFASLRSGEANMRNGPGTRYPIHWVYKRGGIPLEIVNEFGHWRQVRDPEGAKGWMHKSMLSGQRTAMVVKEEQVLRVDPTEDGTPMARIKPGVTGKIKECDANWCELEIGDKRGWLPKTRLWGVYPQEIIE